MISYFFPLVLISLMLIMSQCDGFALESSESKNIVTLTIEPIKMKPSSLAFFRQNPEIYYGLLCDRDEARMNYLDGVVTSMNTSQEENDIVFKPISPKTELGWAFSVLLPLGKPPQIEPLLLDTGSGITWFQCNPGCVNCHPVHQQDTDYPIYDRSKSVTEVFINCGMDDCETRYSTCDEDDHRLCSFRLDYVGGDYTKGVLMNELIVLNGRELMYPLGCTRDTTYNDTNVSGILGLGRSQLSLAQRFIRNYEDLSVFSYCLSPDQSTLLIFSGDYASMLASSTKLSSLNYNQEISYTNLITHPNRPVQYYVDLVGISIGSGDIIEGTEESVFQISQSDQSGGIFLDSGTAITSLIPEAYNAVTKAFIEMASGISGWVPYKPVRNYSTCYNLSTFTQSDPHPTEFQSLNFHFRKAESPKQGRKRNYDDDEYFKLELGFDNVMTIVARQQINIYCLALKQSKNNRSVIGMVSQRNIRVVHDLANARIGFDTNACFI